MTEKNFSRINKIISSRRIVFIGSVDEDGFPNIKAVLSTKKNEGIKVFYFSTNTSSKRVSQYRNNPKAVLYFCDTLLFRGVMLKGTMEILTDSNSKEMLWKKGDTQYYPLGVTDPDYCVLKFTADSGRYYSNFNSESFHIE